MNCSDGSVRLIAEGDGIKLEELIAWCHCGPAGAHVTDVEIRWETPEHTFRGFSIRYEGDA